MSDGTVSTVRKMASSRRERAKSEPLPAGFTVNDVIEPPVVVQGSYNGSPITIYGELHNLVYNQFYEQLNLKSHVIFVEHPSVLCEISAEDKKRLLNVLKGSEWVWYKYKARKLPVVCVDNRIEIGLLSSIEETYIERTDDIQVVAQCVMRALRVLFAKETKEVFVRENLTQYYITTVKAIKTQMDTMLKAGHLGSEELMSNKWKLVKNIVKLSGILVDFHVKKLVEKHADSKKPISIFMGAAHAYRLHKFYPNIFTSISYNTTNPDLIDVIQKMNYE